MVIIKDSFAKKALEFKDIIKMGRTQLQDAVPMTLEQEFRTYAIMIGEDIQRVSEARQLVREINMGATAIGTGINAHPDYAKTIETKEFLYIFHPAQQFIQTISLMHRFSASRGLTY